MGLRPKVACKPHAPDAEQLCKHWQRPGALLPRKCAALFLISNRLTACLKSRQPMFRPQMNLSTLRKAILLPDWEHNWTFCKRHPMSLGPELPDSAQFICTTLPLHVWRTPARVPKKRLI